MPSLPSSIVAESIFLWVGVVFEDGPPVVMVVTASLSLSDVAGVVFLQLELQLLLLMVAGMALRFATSIVVGDAPPVSVKSGLPVESLL